MTMNDQRGFTIIELLAVMSVFAIVSVGLYSVLLSGARSSDVTGSVVGQSEEARLGFNRMVRDIREATEIRSDSTDAGVHVYTDFDGDGLSVGASENPNAQGDYEDLTFSFNEAEGLIRLNGEVLMGGVSKVGTTPLFSYSSSRLEFDTSPGDGVTTLAELQAAQTAGASVDPQANLNIVEINLNVTVDGRTESFYARAELRNRR